MKTENVVLMEMARESLEGKWGMAIGAFLVYILVDVVAQMTPFIGPITSLIVAGPFTLGLAIFSLSISRNQDAKLEQIFQGFNNFGNAIGAYLLMILFILLWSLLFIVPGIIATMSYSMTFYIMSDDNSIDAMEALNKSKEMMDGYKWKLFCLHLRFLGWALLCILTFGIGFLWLFPYMQVSMANFYEDIRADSMISEIL